MTSKYVKRAIFKLTNGSPKQIFNILVEIRTKVIKTSHGSKQLIQHGFVNKLLQLLSEDKKQLPQTVDIILSILGNLCMEESAQKDIHKCGGIPVLADIFCTSESVSIQNRSCRVLSNAALLPVNAESVHKTDTVPRVVELLRLSPSKESKLIYIRTIRLLGKTKNQLERLVNHDAVRCTVQLLMDEDPDIKNVALRTVFELSSTGCSSGFASQVVSAGGIAELLSRITDEDSTHAHQSFTSLIRLVEHSHARAELGNAGGITHFVTYFDNPGNFDKAKRFSILNVLCLCCKDVVNRVKIRDNNILIKFLDSLRSDEFKCLHDRVISALQCFLFDESSVEILLQNGLVPLLLVHLQRVAKFTSDTESYHGRDIKETEDVTLSTDSDQMNPEHVVEDNQMETECSIVSNRPQETVTDTTERMETSKDDGGNSCINIEPEIDGDEKGPNLHKINQSEVNALDLTDDEMDNLNCESSVIVPSDKYQYSIDSPTYQVSSDWNMNMYREGAKCKQSFTHSSGSTSPSSSNKSPMSTISYHSPGLSPGDYSPCHSPSSPGSPISRVNEDPNYPFVCSIPFSYGSPESGLSPTNCGQEDISETEVIYSEDEGDSQDFLAVEKKSPDRGRDSEDSVSEMPSHSSSIECSVKEPSEKKNIFKIDPGVESTQGQIKFNADANISMTVSKEEETIYTLKEKEIFKSQSKMKFRDLQENKSDFKKLEDEDKLKVNFCFDESKKIKETSRKNKVPPTSPESLKDQHALKKQRLHISQRKPPSPTENHVLMILSFVSQMTDPSKHLVSKAVLSCLLDYISLIQNSETRAARVLCRLARNPNCFEKLIQLDFPWIVYRKLLSWEENDNCWIDILKENHSGLDMLEVQRKGHRSRSLTLCSDDSLSLEDDKTGVEIPSDSPKFSDKLNTSDQVLHNEGGEASLQSRAGINILRDLCRMADSPYGRGVITHILSKKEKVPQMHLLISLLHILWTKGMRKYYLFQLGLWDTLMDTLKGGAEDPYHLPVQEAFCFLGKIINLEIKLKKDKCEDWFLPCDVGLIDRNPGENCPYNSYLHDINFCVNGTEIPASKAILAKVSPLFEAMLHGRYSESKQKTVKLNDTCPYAVKFIMHFLHGCTLECDIVNELLTCERNTEMYVNCLDVLLLVDRYLITDLEYFLKTVLVSRFVGPLEAERTFGFAKLHSFEVLANDCVKIVLTGGKCVKDRIKGFKLFLTGQNSDMFLMYIEELFQ